MGFHKRYITKESIINYIKNNLDLSNLVKSDAVIMDSWSSKFFNNYNANRGEYQSRRKELIDDTIYDSFHSTIYDHVNFNKLKSLSNVLYNLYNDSTWVDVLITLEILGVENIPLESRGKFNKLKNICIEKINHYYEQG